MGNQYDIDQDLGGRIERKGWRRPFTIISFFHRLPWWLSGKNLPATQETWVRSLGEEDSPGEGNDNPQEDPLEKEMTTQSRILAWEIPWTEEPGGLQSMGSQRDSHN